MPVRRAIRAGACALALAALPAQAPAHPHVFINAGVDFVFDEAGRLSHLRVTWVYDHLWSLLLLEDLEIAEEPDGRLGDTALAAIAFDQSQWVEDYDGDATLHHDGRRIGLSLPIEPVADYHDGQIEIRFLRALDEPIEPTGEILAKVYDPTYFVAYEIVREPSLDHAPAACAARIVPFEPTSSLAALQQSLFALPPDEDPDEPVGHLFADRVYVTCK